MAFSAVATHGSAYWRQINQEKLKVRMQRVSKDKTPPHFFKQDGRRSYPKRAAGLAAQWWGTWLSSLIHHTQAQSLQSVLDVKVTALGGFALPYLSTTGHVAFLNLIF